MLKLSSIHFTNMKDQQIDNLLNYLPECLLECLLEYLLQCLLNIHSMSRWQLTQYSLNVPMATNYGASPSVSPQPPYQNFYGVSPASVSPQPPYQNYSYIPSSGATHYNIPPQASQTPLANLCIDFNQYRDTNAMDIENLNVPQQQQIFDVLDDSNGIQLPLTDSNINMIDSHLFSNLSIHNEDTTDDNQASTNNALPEFPTFSGIFSSTDLEGTLDHINSASKQ